MDASVAVPHLGVVQVHPIPPKLLHGIKKKATRSGRVDFQELMVWKLVYGVNVTEAEAREITLRFTLRVLQPIIDRIDVLSGTDEHLKHGAGLPHAVRKFTDPMVMATAWLGRLPDAAPTGPRSRESRGAKSVRHRGSRRTTTASRAGPDDPEPEPPAGRACEWCGRDISHKNSDARHCDTKCRVYANRARDKAEPERVAARAVENGTPGRPKWCDCGTEAGSYDLDGDPICCFCGRRRRDARREVGIGFDFAERDRQMRSNGQPARRARLQRDWRTRPSRSLAAQLRKTRRTRKAAA